MGPARRGTRSELESVDPKMETDVMRRGRFSEKSRSSRSRVSKKRA